MKVLGIFFGSLTNTHLVFYEWSPLILPDTLVDSVLIATCIIDRDALVQSPRDKRVGDQSAVFDWENCKRI